MLSPYILLVPGILAMTASAAVTPVSPSCEHLTDPLGVDESAPRLSWKLTSPERAQRQTAYQILVASSVEQLAADTGDVWDSGKVASDSTILIAYAGLPLQPGTRYHWKVRAWDANDQPSAWSAPAFWSTGLLDKAAWNAEWISDPENRLDPDAFAAAQATANSGFQVLGNTNTEEKWVMLDLGGVHTIDVVRLYPALPFEYHPDIDTYFFPLRYTVELSATEDFANAHLVVDETQEDVTPPRIGDFLAYEFPAVQARYVRLTIKKLLSHNEVRHRGALAEFEVLSDGRNLAKDAAISSNDELEEMGWSLHRLIDGVTEVVRPPFLRQPVALLRKEFKLPTDVKRATAYVTARGIYDFYVNGEKVDDRVFAPEWTGYHERIQYQTYDITAALNEGKNAVGAMLAAGWYAGQVGLLGRQKYGTTPQLLVRIDVEFANGKTESIVSDESWKTTIDGPIHAADFFAGEVYDARKELDGWASAGFDDSAWRNVETDADLGTQDFVWQRNQPIKPMRTLQAQKMTEPEPGRYIYDMGQNMVGWVRLQLDGAPGTVVTLRHGEMLHDNGSLYTANLRGADAQDSYTMRGNGPETFEPHFTYHGFRFVEISGLPEPPRLDQVEGVVIYSSSPTTGEFECSDPLYNQLMSNIVWTQRSNMHSVLTDCPQRAERLGWSGDYQAFSQTAIFNMDMAAFMSKTTGDLRAEQTAEGKFGDVAPLAIFEDDGRLRGSPGWGDAGAIIPWRAYTNYADTRILEENYQAVRDWVDFVSRHNPDHLWKNERGFDYGDWLNGDTLQMKGWPTTGGAVPREIFATAFFAHSTDLLSRMAEVLGKTDDAQQYRQHFERIKQAFNRAFVDVEGRMQGETQAGYALALHFGLLPEALRENAAQHMVDGFKRYNGHLSTGIQSTHRLMLELSKFGYTDEAYRLLSLKSFPSWGMSIENGATTIWERWDAYVRGRGFYNPPMMNSFNHVAIGSVGEWMWRNIIGINPVEDAPGYKRFVLRPRPGGSLTWAKGQYESIHGPIRSHWRNENGTFTLDISIPVNTTALVYVPASAADAVTENGAPAADAEGIDFLRMEDGCALFEVRSGEYSFAVESKR